MTDLAGCACCVSDVIVSRFHLIDVVDVIFVEEHLVISLGLCFSNSCALTRLPYLLPHHLVSLHVTADLAPIELPWLLFALNFQMDDRDTVFFCSINIRIILIASSHVLLDKWAIGIMDVQCVLVTLV